MIELQVVYSDEHLVVVVKPPAMLTHKSTLDYHEKTNLVDILTRQLDRPVYPVHRLDKPTSGVLLVALTAAVASAIGEQFEKHTISKTYLGVVRGYTSVCGYINHPTSDRDRPKKTRTQAITYYRTLARIELPHRIDRYPTTRYSLVKINPVTGRRHQIRQHMKHINHPLIGDTSYGKATHNRFFTQLFNCHRLLLHAVSLSLRHPVTGKTLTVYSKPTEQTTDQGQYSRVLQDPHWQAQ